MKQCVHYTGWFIVHRDIYNDSTFKQKEAFSEREAYIWLTANAVYKKTKVYISNKEVHLLRGQLCYAIRFLAKMWDWNVTRVHRYLKKLQQCDKILYSSETGINIITICNYEEKQSPSKDFETEMKQLGKKKVTNNNQIKQTKQKNIPPKSPQSFEERGRAFRIEYLLSDDDRDAAKKAAPGWCQYGLMTSYDQAVNSGKFQSPRLPGKAFVSWCKSYTKGKPP